MLVKGLSASEEAELFPTGEVLVRAGEMDPGLAWIQSSRAVDPDLSITLALARKIRDERGKKDASG